MITLSRSDKSKSFVLDQEKSNAKNSVLEVIEIIRKKHLTGITGQELTYREKEAQARLFMSQSSTPTESESGYEFIFSEVGITSDSATGVAEAIINRANDYKNQIGPAIERIRLLANSRIESANNTNEIESALSLFLQDSTEI